jgi:hypothetical protein
MIWFKFYGQDWLTDIKVISMSMEDRLCFITLLCLASQNSGTIKACSEDMIIKLTHIDNDVTSDDNPFERARGCLERFRALGMITYDNNDNVINDNNDNVINDNNDNVINDTATVTHDNILKLHNVTVVNFVKRQGTNLTNYEKVKKFRESQKILLHNMKPKSKNVINDNKDDVINGNARLDKIRLDKNIIYKETSSLKKDEIFDWPTYLEKMKDSEVKHIKLIGIFFEEKGLVFENREQVGNAIKRYTKDAAAIIKGKYPDTKLDAAFDWSKKLTPVEWGLSTVLKYLVGH